MQINHKWLYNAIAVLIVGFFGYCYLDKLVIPSLAGYNDFYVISGDSSTYYDHSDDETILEMSSTEELFHHLGTSNLLGMAFTVWCAKFLSNDKSEYVIFALNLILLFATLRNYELIFQSFGPKQYPKFLFLFCINPLLIVGLASVSKEIWGIFFISAFLRYRISGSYFRYFFAVILSFFIRDILLVIGILFFCMSTLKFNKYLYIFAISIVIPYIMPSDMIDLLVEGQDDRSLGVSMFMNTIQSYPFGYLITYFPKLIMSAFSNLSPLRFITDNDNIIGICTTISSLLSFIFSIRIFKNTFSLKYHVQPILADLFFAYTFAVVVTAFIHHRYLFPLYPVILMMALLPMICFPKTISIEASKLVTIPRQRLNPSS